MSATNRTDKCYECDMPLADPAEFHPWLACETYKRTHDSRIVYCVLRSESVDIRNQAKAKGRNR